ncbi:TraR/DksA family transcriptional regulator [Sneathiella chungangensis]|uniref:TraR/DksA family transcriptional regulator n=1 Tax=Sneathiella chungangensis TaxID=1418234 RepID=A0A845MLV1_9PROT|nr:TraR/DksA C4-type zinc finger protein [Sneathiella chungangensis]MZR24140.1 TraR/DksA family transcriptional regulator [Sneathiella chungangensis]
MKAVETQLRDRLAEEIRRLEAIEQRLRGAHSASFGEQAVEREGDQVDERLEETVIHEIEMIKAALDRIEAGNYKSCASCGKEIRAARLEALPYTTLCIACAQERSGKILTANRR